MPVIEDLTFTATCDGSPQRYVLQRPPGCRGGAPRDALIALHGHGADRWQFIRDTRGECRAVREVAAAHRMLLVAPDYRASTSWMGPAAEADMVDLTGLLRERFQLGRLILCGASMGGASSLTLAALHPVLFDGVVAMNGVANHLEYGNFQDAIRGSFGGTREEVPEEYRKRSAEFQWEKLTMPVALTTGGKDASTPPASVLRLARKLEKTNPHVLLIHRADQGHRTSYEDARSALEFVLEKSVSKDFRTENQRP